MRVIKVSCPGCAANLEVGDDLALAICAHCGAKIILDWEGQISLAAHLELGQSFLQAGNYAEANMHFSRALEKNPRSRDAWFWKGMTAALMKNFAEADTYWRKSAFTTQETIDHLLQVMSGLSWDVAGEFIDLAAEVGATAKMGEKRKYPGIIMPGEEGEFIGLAAKVGEWWHWGEMFLEAALQIDPGKKSEVAVGGYFHGGIPRHSGYGWLALCASGVGQFERAVSYLERALQIDPDKKSEVAYGNLAWQAGEAGQFERAASYLERGLEIAPDTKPDAAGTSGGYIMLANLAGEAERRFLARAYLKRATALDRSVKPEAKEVARELRIRLW